MASESSNSALPINMAGQSDSTKLSSKEDVDEKKRVLKEAENSAVASSSGIIAENVDDTRQKTDATADETKESLEDSEDGKQTKSYGNNGAGCQVLPQEIKIAEESADDIIKRSREAARIARRAALCCQKSVFESSIAIKIGVGRIYAAVKKDKKTKNGDTATEMPEHSHFHDLAQRWRKITQDVTSEAIAAQTAQSEAITAAINADLCRREVAHNLEAPAKYVPKCKLPYLLKKATCAMDKATIAANVAFTRHYQLLQAIKTCWETANYKADCDPESTANYCDNDLKVLLIDVSAVFLFVSSIVLFSMTKYTMSNVEYFGAVLGSGVLTSVLALTLCVYRLCKINKVRRFKRERPQVIAKIEEELQDFTEYAPASSSDAPQ